MRDSIPNRVGPSAPCGQLEPCNFGNVRIMGLWKPVGLATVAEAGAEIQERGYPTTGVQSNSGAKIQLHEAIFIQTNPFLNGQRRLPIAHCRSTPPCRTHCHF
jgi:hypothetical protein